MAWYERASDNFNRADENPLSKGGMWTNVTALSPFKIQNNVAVVATANSQSVSYYSGYAFGNNQYSEVYLSATTYPTGPSVRCGATSAYILTANRSGTKLCQVYKYVSGVWTALGSNLGASLSGSAGILRLEMAGNVLKIIDGVVTLGTLADNTLASGKPGLYGYYSTSSLDDWKAGDDVYVGGWLKRNYWWNQAYGNVRG